MDYTQFVDGLLHEPTQTEGRGLDLTAAEVAEVTGPGRVDFGGGELDPATLETHPTRKRDGDDDYAWWHLDAGTYLVEYNESLAAEDLVFTIQTRDALRERGAFHPTLHLTELGRVPLTVGGAGLKLKENARVSTVVGVEPV
jgi:hypothetical protein